MKTLNDLSIWLGKKTTYLVLAVALVFFMSFMIWVLPKVSATTEEVTGTSLSPDMSFFYSTEDMYQIASDYGDEGRRYYIRSRFTFDVIWPMAYGFFLVAALSMTFKKPMGGKSLIVFNLLPIGGVFFDYLENITAALVMFIYPRTTAVAYFTPYFTLLKWILIYAAFAVLLLGGIFRVIRKM